MVTKSNSECNCHSSKCNCKKGHGLKNEVIRVPKVYDWVNDSVTVTKEVFFGEEEREAIEIALADPSRRPLRLVARVVHGPNTFCEQFGETRNVVVPIGGEFVNAQQVDLLLNAEVEIEVIDRHGDFVTEASVDIASLDSIVLCHPHGTELMCRLREVLAEITSGTVLLNGETPCSFFLNVTFCVDVQVEAEVKLEILAKFASPRENNLEAVESASTKCPAVHFPEQCPDIFPVNTVCTCSATGEASGNTTTTPEGRAGVFVKICTSGRLENSTFDFTFDPNGGDTNLVFTADTFDPETFQCKHSDNGLKLLVSGTGHLDNGTVLDFKLALVDSHTGDQFQVQLENPQNGNVVFNTGVVDVDEGNIEINKVN